MNTKKGSYSYSKEIDNYIERGIYSAKEICELLIKEAGASKERV